MQEIKLFKFDALGDRVSEGIIIKITEDLPEFLPFTKYDDVQKFYDAQASLIVNALLNNLPQGTMFRVLYKLMENYSKEVLYRGKTGT